MITDEEWQHIYLFQWKSKKIKFLERISCIAATYKAPFEEDSFVTIKLQTTRGQRHKYVLGSQPVAGKKMDGPTLNSWIDVTMDI